jgi:hypothetical protein
MYTFVKRRSPVRFRSSAPFSSFSPPYIFTSTSSTQAPAFAAVALARERFTLGRSRRGRSEYIRRERENGRRGTGSELALRTFAKAGAEAYARSAPER